MKTAPAPALFRNFWRENVGSGFTCGGNQGGQIGEECRFFALLGTTNF
jgi:hypothetical protein